MRIFKRLFALMLIMTLMLSTVSCGDKTSDSSDDDNDPSSFSVTVLNPFGKPISDVVVYVHRDGESDYNICTNPVQTDSDGKAKFILNPEYSYSVQLVNLPEVYTSLSGYSPSERYAFDSNHITVTVDANDGYAPENYKVGDPIANTTLYDIDGNKYEIYDLLEEKKAVVLNFWFSTCGPCRAEFPSLNAAYIAHSDNVEVLAINDYPYDGDDSVETYENKIGFDLSMPLFKVDTYSDISLSRFPSNGYPTTVVIDRYGIVSLIHVGYVPEASRWNAMFNYYSSDSYDGTPFDF